LPTIAYITIQFPSPVEWYVVEEIRELRRRGVQVIPYSVRRVNERALSPEFREFARETTYLEPLRWGRGWGAVWLCLRHASRIADLLKRIVFEGNEPVLKRARALVHTLLGGYFFLLLRGRGVDHIHVHHGYFASWIALVASRLSGIPFSLTLHGSDLLVHAPYLGTKLAACKFCLTVSQFNRRHIAAHYPEVDLAKVHVQHLGVEGPATTALPLKTNKSQTPPLLLSVGRLHPVKNHVFLLQACFLLRECGTPFRCWIAGEGPERRKLEFLMNELKLTDQVTLLGHVPRREVLEFYAETDLVVLTSHSEGIPLVLMEALAFGKVVLAPDITGIPELVVDGKTGFLYKPGALEEFVWRAQQICGSLGELDAVRRAARHHVRTHFNQKKNLERLGDLFLEQVGGAEQSPANENLVLQQI
jgi:glycosyltransferase involved in cell wall biosynthesis